MERLEANGHDDVSVEFVPDDTSDLSFIDAMHQAGNIADAEVTDAAGDGPLVTIVGGSMKLKRLFTSEAPGRWLSVFTRELRARGCEGTIHPTPSAALPRWYLRLGEPQVTVYSAFDRPFFQPETANSSTPATTPDPTAIDTRATCAVNLLTARGTASFVDSAGLNLPAPANAPRQLLRMLYASITSTFTCLDSDRQQAAAVTLNRNGQQVFQFCEPTRSLPGQVDLAREALILDAASTRLAFAALTRGQIIDWSLRADKPNPLPAYTREMLRQNTAIWSRYVPDAHGMQLLTPHHLDNATDLSAWEVTQVAPERYLVEAADLSQWLRPEGPEDSVLARARTDFGAMIVTPDTYR